MALQRTRLSPVAYIAAAAAAIYTNAASTKSFVRGLLLHNTNATTETVAIYWVPPSGGSAGTAALANRIFNLTLVANETLLIEVPFSLVMIDTNETIQALTTTASKVTCAVIGDTDA